MFFRALLTGSLIFATVGSVFAQDNSQPEGKAFVSGSYGAFSEEHVRTIFDNFFVELSQRENSKGLVAIYGPIAELTVRKKLMANHIIFRGVDPKRIGYRLIGGKMEPRTDLWIIPSGAREPEIERKAWIGLELGRVTNTVASRRITEFFEMAFSDEDIYTIYIANYGTPAQIDTREKLILKNVGRMPDFPSPRITLVRGGDSKKPGSLFWIIPPGAGMPPV